MSPSPNGSEKSVGEIVSEVSEKASLLVREEIELAKAEVTQKVKTLGKGAGVGVAAGVFLIFAFVVFLEALSWFFNDLLDVQSALWVGFLITALLLTLFGAISGYLAYRWLRTGPPTPDMAIEEAKLIRDDLEHLAANESPEIGLPAGSKTPEETS